MKKKIEVNDDGNAKRKIGLLRKRIISARNELEIGNFFDFLVTAEMVFKYFDDELQVYSLNQTQLYILLELVVLGGTATPTELSNQMLRSKFAITKAVDSLQKAGLTKSEKTELDSKIKADRRLRKVSLTEKGLETVRNVISLNRQVASSVMGRFNSEEARQFKSCVNLLKQNMQQLLDLKVKIL
jgi:DNA-binding MarR family transcriptional regulator